MASPAKAAADPDDDFWNSLGAEPKKKPATAAAGAPAAQPDDEEKFWSSLGAQPRGVSLPTPEWRHVPPYQAPDGAWTTIAPEDYPSFNEYVKAKTLNPDPAPGAEGEIDPLTGKPFVFMAPSEKGSPVAESLGKPIAEGKVPGPITQAIVGLPAGADAQRRIMASRLFPDEPPTKAQSRLFMAPGGRMAAVGADGMPFYVQPDPYSIAPSNVLSLSAANAGAMLPAAGAIMGGMAGTPGSPLGSIPLAGAGAALGDQARQYLARWADPSPERVAPNPLQTAKEAGIAALGQGAGNLVNRILAPNALRVPVPDVRAIRAPGGLDAARDAYANARAQGVDLTPGQATGLPSLLSYEDAATRAIPGTRDIADAFYRQQGLQLRGAADAMLDTISPNANKTEAAQMVQEGANEAIVQARRQANAAARPSYDAAQTRGQVLSPDLAQLMDQPSMQRAMNVARNVYQDIYRRPAPETPDFRLWDLTKRALDDMHTAATRNADGLSGRTTAEGINSLRQDLIQHLDTAYPEYATARETAAPGQRLAARLEDSGTGTAAGGTGSEKARAIVGPLFNQNPHGIAESRAAFEAAGRMDEWNAGIRSYIQDAIDRASMSQQGLNPSSLRRKIWNDVDVRDALQAAMSPTQFDGFNRFLQVVDHAGRTYPMNSLTTPRAEAAAALRDASAQSMDIKVVRSVMNALSLPRLVQIPGQIGDAYMRMRSARNLGEVVGHLFNPDGLQFLEQMARYSPNDQRAVAATAQMLSRYAIGAAERAASYGRPEAESNRSAPLPANPLVSAP